MYSLRHGHLDLVWLLSSHFLCKCLSTFYLLVALQVSTCVTGTPLAITRGLRREKPSCLLHDVKCQKIVLEPDTQQHSRDL